MQHSNMPFHVSGILARTGTPLDRSVLVSLEGITAIHIGWEAGVPTPGLHVTEQDAERMNLTPTSITALGNTVLFAATDGLQQPQTGNELWRSDGTSAGTTLVKDISFAPTGSSMPQDLVDVNGTLFFSADDGIHGRELWKSDGSAASTVLVKDINTTSALASYGRARTPSSASTRGATASMSASARAQPRERRRGR